jgi:DNA helicase-2/ATP-dependent DNA helicase PcrA
MKNYLQKLNPEQYDAATTINGRVFILAGAGSGKTATLVSRVAYMIDQDINPKEILLLTFTNKAAKEMKSRIQDLIGTKANQITACTFHSFCAVFLRKNANLIGFSPDFTIIDSPDMMDALSMSKQSFLSDKKAEQKEYNLKDFPSTSKIGQVYEASVNNNVSQEKIIGSISTLAEYETEILDILKRFKEYKKSRNLMDYNDLLYFTQRLLENDEFLRKKIDEQYKYISCDEYQDTNTIQNEILNLMTKDYPNLAVVGDDNQSIYAFRYANIDNILNFDKIYPECKTIVLNQNYRSSQEILDLSNVIMNYAIEGKQKKLKGMFKGQKPCLIVKEDCYDEADYIVRKIQEIDCDLSDIAIICRSASQTYILEQKLNMVGIPFDKFGGLKFTEKAIIKELLAFLRLSINDKDELALFRLLQLYPGIGKTYAQKISTLVITDSFDKAKDTYKKRVFAPYIAELCEVINKLKSLELKDQLTFLIEEYYPEVMDRKIKLQSISESKKSDAYAAFEDTLIDAETLKIMASKYKSTVSFLADIVLDATIDDDETIDKLNITTIHSAKGLEYKVVFIMDCIEGVTPRCPEHAIENPEELRCLYVAVTRAKNELYIMIPQYYNMKNIKGYLSHFINKPDILNTCKRNVSNAELRKLVSPIKYYF